MKQSTLNFTASKRTASTNNAKKAKAGPSVPNVPVLSGLRTGPGPKKEEKKVLRIIEVSDGDEDSEGISDETSSEDDQEEEIESDAYIANEPAEKIENTPPPTIGRVTRSSSNKVTPKAESKKAVKSSDEGSADTIKATVFKPSNATPENVAKKVAANEAKEANDESLPELNVKDPKYNKHYAEVRQKMNWHNPIHAENQNKIHEILRVFDNTYEYGPCVGVSRRERWDRAKALGLNPPKEVDAILNTKQGKTLPEYSQSVFFGEV